MQGQHRDTLSRCRVPMRVSRQKPGQPKWDTGRLHDSATGGGAWCDRAGSSRPEPATRVSGLLQFFDSPLEHLVDQAKFLGRFGREELVALQRLLDLLDALAGVLDVDLIETLANVQDFLGV